MNSEHYVVIKGRFQSLERKYYGIFVLTVNPKTSVLSDACVIISIYSELYDINLRIVSVKELQDKIANIRHKGQFSQVPTLNVQDSFKSLAHDYAFFREVNYFIKRKEDTINMETCLKAFLIKTLYDKSILLNIVIEEVSDLDLQASPLPVGVESNNKILAVDLVLAPVGGVLITKLQVGDIIMVRPNGNNNASNNYISMLNLRTEEGTIKNIPAKIVSIEPSMNGLNITTLVDENQAIYGQTLEEEKVLVRLYDPASNIAQQIKEAPSVVQPSIIENSNEINKQKPQNMNMKIIVVVAVLLFLFLLLYLLDL